MLIPIHWPWCNSKGQKIPIYEIIKSRRFSLSYLATITAIWIFLGFGHWGSRRCETLGEQLACASAIWPNKMFTFPHEYLLSFLTSPFFHNDFQHYIFIIIGVAIFCQSFEAFAGTKKTMMIFFTSIAFTSLSMGIIMNTGHTLYPENEFFSHAMERSWMGGSVGMMGVIGALSHYSDKKWLVPLLIITFEIWNRYENGMNEYITFGHLTSVIFGYIIWGWKLKLIDVDK